MLNTVYYIENILKTLLLNSLPRHDYYHLIISCLSQDLSSSHPDPGCPHDVSFAVAEVTMSALTSGQPPGLYSVILRGWWPAAPSVSCNMQLIVHTEWKKNIWPVAFNDHYQFSIHSNSTAILHFRIRVHNAVPWSLSHHLERIKAAPSPVNCRHSLCLICVFFISCLWLSEE